MRFKILFLLIFSVICFADIRPLSAQTSNIIEAKLLLSADQVKTHDVLHMAVSLHNISSKEVSIELFLPYSAAPEIKNAKTDNQASWWSPPTDGPVMMQTITLKPGQEYGLTHYDLKIIDGDVEGKGGEELGNLLRPVEWAPNAGLPHTAGLMSDTPGIYSVKFTFTFNSINVETVAKTFQIMESLHSGPGTLP